MEAICSSETSVDFQRTTRSYIPLVSCLAYSSILKMEAICSSETSVDFQRTTRSYIPLVSSLAYSSILKMEAICSSETSVDFQRTTRRYIAGFLLGLFFYPEDGGDVFLRNVSWHSMDYTMLYPLTLHNHRCENLKSYTGSYCWVISRVYPYLDYVTSKGEING
jgi:hypothetical protein